MKDHVSIIGCDSYDQQQVDRAVSRAIHEIGGDHRQKNEHHRRLGGGSHAAQPYVRARFRAGIFDQRRSADGREEQNHAVAAQIVQRFCRHKRNPSCAEQTADVGGNTADACGVEDHEADQHKEQHIDVLDSRRKATDELAQPQLFNHEEYSEIHAPDDEIPVRAVPEAREHPYHEYIKEISQL